MVSEPVTRYLMLAQAVRVITHLCGDDKSNGWATIIRRVAKASQYGLVGYWILRYMQYL